MLGTNVGPALEELMVSLGTLSGKQVQHTLELLKYW